MERKNIVGGSSEEQDEAPLLTFSYHNLDSSENHTGSSMVRKESCRTFGELHFGEDLLSAYLAALSPRQLPMSSQIGRY
jgi:hypothetical protein